MPDPKKKPTSPFTLELSGMADLRLEPEKPQETPKLQLPKHEVNEDILHRLINCVKKI